MKDFMDVCPVRRDVGCDDPGGRPGTIGCHPAFRLGSVHYREYTVPSSRVPSTWPSRRLHSGRAGAIGTRCRKTVLRQRMDVRNGKGERWWKAKHDYNSHGRTRYTATSLPHDVSLLREGSPPSTCAAGRKRWDQPGSPSRVRRVRRRHPRCRAKPTWTR